MSKSRLSLVLLLALASGFALSRYAFAQSPHSPSAAGDMAMERLERLVSDLTARKDTNTLTQVKSLLDANETLIRTRDAATAVALLQRLRAGRTDQVMEVLEIKLDGALAGLGSSPQEIGESQIRTLELAKQYRTKYPRKQDAGVTRAFESLQDR